MKTASHEATSAASVAGLPKPLLEWRFDDAADLAITSLAVDQRDQRGHREHRDRRDHRVIVIIGIIGNIGIIGIIGS